MLDKLKRLFSRSAAPSEPISNKTDPSAESARSAALPEELPLDAALAVANGRVSEEYARAEVQRVLKEHRRRLREANDNPASMFAASMVDPYSWMDDAPDFYPGFGGMGGWGVPWMLNNQGRGDCLPVYINEYGLKLIRDWSRKIVRFNEFAINAVENRVSYITGKGFGYTVIPKRRAVQDTQSLGVESGAEPKGLAAKAQAVLDEFINRERWGEREQECIRREDRDGEAFLRFFRLANGRAAVRFVEPECVTDTAGSIQRMYGVITEPGDIEDVRAYSIADPGDGWTVEDVPAAEVLHLKANTDFDCKRGLPTLFAVRKNLERADKLLRNMSVMAQVQATFAVLRKHKQFSPSSVSVAQQQQQDFNGTIPISGRPLSMRQLLPGSIIDASDKTDYEFPAAGVNAGGLVQVLQAELRAVCSRLVMPEWMLTVDASNANYASSLVAEAPAVKNFERLQAWHARRFGDGEYGRDGKFAGAMWRVLRIAVDGGLLPREALSELEIQVEAPTLVVRNKAEETNRSKLLFDAGMLSAQTWSKWEGLDFEQEKQQGAKQQGTSAAGSGEVPGADADKGIGGLDFGEELGEDRTLSGRS